MKRIEKYTIGVGDRFGLQGRAQLAAMVEAAKRGVAVCPVWNKSHREHTIIGTTPESVRAEAEAAVRAVGWKSDYYVDADHIGMKNVDLFIASSNFFTLDVADFTGKPASGEAIAAFVNRNRKYIGRLELDGMDESVWISEELISNAGAKFLLAVQEAARIYRHIADVKGNDDFVAEVSMDETDVAQSPVEMLLILEAIAQSGIPAQTIAPRFTGRFNKGVDYVGDVSRFAREFEQDLAVIRFAVREFGLPDTLKLSVHSGSDKFSLYPHIRAAIRRFDAGLHLKTAGTTWLEELAGLALAGGDGLAIAQDTYALALRRFDELCGPYATVIDIRRERLPTADEVRAWSGEEFAAALTHDPSALLFNPDFRQLIHVGYKIAAEMGARYIEAVRDAEEVIGPNVTENLYERHLRPLFINPES